MGVSCLHAKRELHILSHMGPNALGPMASPPGPLWALWPGPLGPRPPPHAPWAQWALGPVIIFIIFISDHES